MAIQPIVLPGRVPTHSKHQPPNGGCARVRSRTVNLGSVVFNADVHENRGPVYWPTGRGAGLPRLCAAHASEKVQLPHFKPGGWRVMVCVAAVAVVRPCWSTRYGFGRLGLDPCLSSGRVDLFRLVVQRRWRKRLGRMCCSCRTRLSEERSSKPVILGHFPSPERNHAWRRGDWNHLVVEEKRRECTLFDTESIGPASLGELKSSENKNLIGPMMMV